MATTGFVTIGQAPRPDILRSMVPYASVASCIETGALDNIDEDELAALAPTGGATPFVSRLRDGREVLIDKQKLMPRLQKSVDRAIDDGARSIVIVCTGSFPEITAQVPLIFPDHLLRANVDQLLPAGNLGIVMPNEGQRAMMHEKWERPGRQIVAVGVSPYASDGKPDHAAIESLANCDLVVLDCMGFSEEMRSAWQEPLSVPVILANRLVGRILEELDPALRQATPVSGVSQSAD